MLDPTPIWYGASPVARLLVPLSWLYCGIVRLRRLAYRWALLRSEHLGVPVIVVGNLSVGGTGKTPLTLYLAGLLRAHGWTPAIIARGYGGRSQSWPQFVEADSDPQQVGDEPVLLAARSGCAVVAGPDRVAAGRLVIERAGCDILLSDDGLQHYALARDLEIALVDGQRGFGNGHCLPAGPLREPAQRLTQADLVVYKDGAGQGLAMRLVPGALVNLVDPRCRRGLEALRGSGVLAVAGIGDPERFFALLESHGLSIERRPFPDHYSYTGSDVASWGDRVVIMTEKDAVKCAAFAAPNHWYLPVQAQLDDAFDTQFLSKLIELREKAG
ncbi:tetraacyldisaccharide 4'-kinase [Thiorhodococcus mannitoliphagus]|uniref:Tetraacyldisaccharide 4'-kinase n=1 Tax=Thiorhodococcus mannitoliphagus TaxID=329406 RepID=A0A6P1DX19_9GAMM|nr:tetraacyldisaccharide 4'-kinase [Thiorhodococcus mannitoliphagus]NEX21531.1 tetraacyldisaccharide 4'-kinase [Thiorhodococcus mannitoliphagus]